MSRLIVQSDVVALPFADRSVDLVFGSPPYCDARTYGINAQRACAEWIGWMLRVTTECLRVSRGPVVWVAWGVTRKRMYWPACEGLMWLWWVRGGAMYRPCFWHRVGIPGSGGDQWFRGDVEYVMCFKRPGPLPWSDNTAMGHKPKWGPGGEMSHRLSDGARVNQWDGSPSSTRSRRQNGARQDSGRPSHVYGNRPSRANARADRGNDQKRTYFNGRRFPANRRQHTKARADDSMEVQWYESPVLANPGNLIHTKTGGNNMGSKIAHENEAPFPEALAEFFLRSLCPPGGTVLDPFSGSGTTAEVAMRFGRHAVASDIRFGECIKTKRRTNEIQAEMFA